MAPGFFSARILDKVSHDGTTSSGTATYPPAITRPVLMEKKLAATTKSEVACSGVMTVGLAHAPPPSYDHPLIVVGSGTVLINDLPAARWAPSGDLVACNAQLGSPPEGVRTVLIGGPTTSELACKELQAMIDARLAELKRWNAEDQKRLKKWFGKADEKTRKMMLARMKKMQKLLKTYDKKSFSGLLDRNKFGIYAQVDPSNDKLIELGNTFADCKAKGPNSRASVVAHEMSHFKTVGDTDDVEVKGKPTYGQKRSKALAKKDPANAQKNADNWSYWVEGQ